MKEDQLFYADTRPSKKYLVDGITKDVTLEDAIFDLIDNSIDAYKKNNDNSLPKSYKNYEIEINFNSNHFSIKDNGIGIDLETLRSNALKFGSLHKHLNTSIGYFGIGLNRALLKLGKLSEIITTKNKTSYTLTFDALKFIQEEDYWNLPINKLGEEINDDGTKITIKNLNSDIKNNLNSKLWVKNFRKSISERYSFFINKDLKILINNEVIPKIEISINNKCGFKKLETKFETNQVHVNIEFGQHKDFLFTYEQTNGKKNLIKPKNCGWFVFCNGRAIKLYDWSSDTGWYTQAHAQHNGFIGIVHFIGEGSRLPWSTSKSNLDLNNETYKEALKFMKDFSEQWRSHTGKIKNGQMFFYDQNILPIREIVQQTSQISLDYGDIELTTANTNTASYFHESQSHITPNYYQNHFLLNTPVSLQPNNNNTSHQVQSESITTLQVINDSDENNNFTEFLLFEQNYSSPSHTLGNEYLFGEFNGKTPFNIPKTESKLCSILNELSRIKLNSDKGFPLAAIFLIRCFIELSCKYYARTTGKPLKIDKDTLGQQVKKCLDNMREKNLLEGIDTRNIDSIYALCNENRQERTNRNIRYLQNTVHSPDLMWDKESIQSFWLAIQPFLIKCFHPLSDDKIE